jgi:outer membrane protein
MIKKLLVTLASLAAFAVSAPAQKVAVVEMDKVYQGHWKTEDFINKLQGARADLEAKVQSLREEGQAMVENFNVLRERLNSPAANREATEREVNEAGQKIQEKQQEIQLLVQRTQAAANERQNNHRITVMDEIRRTAGEIAKRRGATLCVDSSGRAVNGALTLVWAADEINITDEVLKEVNKDRPANITPPPAAPAPASGGSDEIRLPGSR